MKHFLGLEIVKKGGSYFLNQKYYINKLFDRFGVKDCKPSSFPLDPGYFKISCEEKFQDNEKYRSLIGSLLYLAVNSRPDIAASVSILSQKNSDPLQADWIEAKRILRYLKFTFDYCLKLGGDRDQDLVAYSDANWASDTSDRRSTSGGLFQFGGSTINWFSRKQSCVTLSSTEAEYYALADTILEVVWLRQLLEEFGEKQKGPSVIYEDNQSCIKLANSEQFGKRSKHIATKFQFIKENAENCVVKFIYCPTSNMIADNLTKPLQAIKIKRFAQFRNL